MIVSIESTTRAMDLDVKRFYFPAIVAATCPRCGKRVERDFSQDYLSYPSANELIEVTFHHTDGEPYLHHEWKEQMVLRLTLEAVEDDDD